MTHTHVGVKSISAEIAPAIWPELFLCTYDSCLYTDIQWVIVTAGLYSSTGFTAGCGPLFVFSSVAPEVNALNLMPSRLRLIKASVAMISAVSGCEKR